MNKIETEKKKLEAEKQRLKEKEKRILEKAKRAKTKSLAQIGKLAYQAKISHLDQDVLLGAFLIVSELAKDESYIQKWKRKAEEAKAGLKQEDQTPLTIAFDTPPPNEIKSELKELKFKWNSFRGEYYGYGDLESVKKLLDGLKSKIEVVL